MRPRPMRFVRDGLGRILDVRPADDPPFDREWLLDEGVRALFKAKDDAFRLAHGATQEDLDREARQVAAAEARLRSQSWRRR